MQVPLLDLKQQYAMLEDELLQEIAEVCSSQQFILGPKVTEFEEAVAGYCSARYACGVTSGSDALLIALMAEKIGPGDEVITSAYSFFATAGAISRTGAKPVFVDIEPRHYTMDITKVAERITPRTRAIIPVHLYGQTTNMRPLLELAAKHSLCVIEDACQAIGAEDRDKRAGGMGEYGCLSFFPSKNLGGFGDSGMVLCNDQKRDETLKILRNHGMAPQYHHHVIGSNFRIDALQAAILKRKLKYLDSWTESRQKNFADYRLMLKDCPDIVCPDIAPWCTRHVCNQFVIRIKNGLRDKVWDALKNAGVGCAVYYPIPLHLQECFKSLGYQPGDFPESEAAAQQTLALPIFPELSHIQKKYVGDTLLSILKELGN
jgi:dTDP-4-amino-4,6-dideoxygalactose transaminase